MADDALFTGIDIGSTAIRVAVGQRMAVGEKESVHIIGAAEYASEGINRGSINSIEDAVSSVSSCLERAERELGAQLGSAWISVDATQVNPLSSKGVVAVARPDGEIREDDVDRALQQAQTVAMPANFETIHVLPKSFAVDGQANVKDPVGMTGIRLEVDTQIIQAQASYLRNLTKCVYRTGINLEQPVLGVLATAEVVATPRQKELGVAVVNIGAASTSVAVFENGDLIHTASVPIGSDHVTADLAIGLRTTLDVAEQVKLECASAAPGEFSKTARVDLAELGADDQEQVSLRFVAEIVQARFEELLERLDKELIKVERSGLLPAGLVLTGGGSKTPGLIELAKKRLRLPVQLGYPMNVTSYTDRVQDLAFTTAIGLVQWGINETGPTGAGMGFGQGLKAAKQTVGKLKSLFGVRR